MRGAGTKSASTSDASHDTLSDDGVSEGSDEEYWSHLPTNHRAGQRRSARRRAEPRLNHRSDRQRSSQPRHSSKLGSDHRRSAYIINRSKSPSMPLHCSKIRRGNSVGESPVNQCRDDPAAVTVGDYSNPFDQFQARECADGRTALRLEKMRDAIDLYRFLSIPDKLGFSRRPLYRPFMMRNLSYLRQRPCFEPSLPIPPPTIVPEENGATIAGHAERPGSADSTTQGDSMPSSIHFNFIRNNLCFGDKSAIVQCYHVTEADYTFGALERIPSSTFDMRVNEKLRHISIDLPDTFSADFLAAVKDSHHVSDSSSSRGRAVGNSFAAANKSRVQYFVVRVVFRYADAEVGGGKRLRKIPSRPDPLPSTANPFCFDSESGESTGSPPSSKKRRGHEASEEVVMFGAKAIVRCSQDEGLDVLHGEASIVLFSSADLKITDAEWRDPAPLISRLLKLQRKPVDNPFMSVQIQIQTDSDEESSSDEEDRAEGAAASSSTCAASLGANTGTSPAKIALKFLIDPFTTTLPSDYDWPAAAMAPGEGRDTPEGESAVGSGQLPRHIVRVVNAAFMCFFCFTRIKFPDLNAYLHHLQFSHPRLAFTYEPAIPVSRSLRLPGFLVDLNQRYDGSHEWDADWPYCRSSSACRYPRRREVVIDPVWIVTKEESRSARQFQASTIGEIASSHAAYPSVLKDFSFAHAMMRGGARFMFKPPTRINHSWLCETNHQNLGEITDLHESEQRMMRMWNDFLAEIRISHLGKSMLYKAMRAFVERKAAEMRELNLHTNFLLHLTNLYNAGVLDSEERYDLFMRLGEHYDPAGDDVHFVSRQLEALEKEHKSMVDNGVEGNPAETLRQAATQAARRSIRVFADLRSLYPFATTRRLERLAKFMEENSAGKFVLTAK